MITSRHYLLEILQILKLEEEQMKEMKPTTKYAGLGAAVAAELMVSFWFDIGVILAVGVADGLNYCVDALTSNK